MENHARFSTRFFTLAHGVFWLTASWAVALDAKGVFAKVSPSTVLIQDLDSHGTGLLLNDKGLILTNYHVVAAQIAPKVKARVKFGDKVVLAELADVKLVKVHPTYDLALLEVKAPPNGSFIPAQMVPKGTPVDTGSKCYAIGNPGGPGGEALELSITEGLISLASRKIQEMEFVQFSAAVNPGNSGGPVCDEEGRVFGVVTWKMEGTEGAGFAIPTQNLALGDFVEVKDLRPKADWVALAEEVGKRLYLLSKLASPEDRVLLFQMAAECYRAVIAADPTRPQPFHMLGFVYQNSGEPELAKAYYEAALRVDPKFSSSCHFLGLMLVRENEANRDRSIDLWFRGMTDSQPAASSCAEDVATEMVYYVRNFMAAAYMLRWAEVLDPARDDTSTQSRRGKLWSKIKDAVPAEQIAAIKDKSDGFNRAAFDALREGKTLAMVTGPSGSGTVLKQPVASADMTKAQMEQAANETAAKFKGRRVAVPAGGMEVSLPEEPVRLQMASAGSHVVMQFPQLAKLGIFNMQRAAFDGFVDILDKHAMFAAGGHLLVVYAPSTQIFEVYDLNTLEKKAAVKNPISGAVHLVRMGTLNPERLFVLSEFQEGTVTNYKPHLLHLPDLRETDLDFFDEGGTDQLGRVQVWPNQPMDGCADAFGERFVAWHTQVTTSKMLLCELRPGGEARLYHQRVAIEAASIMDDGSLLALDKVIVPWNEAAAKESSSFSSKLFGNRSDSRAAVLGYPGVLEYHAPVRPTAEGGVSFKVLGPPLLNPVLEMPVSTADVVRLKLPEFRKLWLNAESNRIAGPAIVASNYCGRFGYVMPEVKRLALFDLPLGADASNEDLARPGARFQRKLKVVEGSEVVVQSAPAGLKYDPASNALVWDVPNDFKTGQMIQVIIKVKAPGGKAEYVIERIPVP